MPLTLLSFGFLAMLRECQSVTVCGYVSDERALRYEFGIPDEVQLIDLYSPTATTFFGREGLTIDATFQFTPEQFNRYLGEQISTDNGWEPLPVPQDLLWHIGRIEEYAKWYIEREYGVDETLEDQGEVSPTPGYLEAELRRIEAEHYEAFLQRLPPFPDSGYYSCRTAGTNVLYTTKTTCDDPDYINDFILATLDINTLELYIKVSTYY
jgi:hypothetical protein